MDKSAATARITRELHLAEEAFDDTMLRLSTLLSSMIQARQSVGVEPIAGQAALMRLVRAQQSLLESQNDLNRTHRELRKTAIEVKAMPDEDYCPPKSRAYLASATSGSESEAA